MVDCSYIKREDMIEALQNHYEVNNAKQNAVMDECVMLAMRVPSELRENVYAKWAIVDIIEYPLSCGATAYEPRYRCSRCARITESYVRMDEPIMPDDADFPNFCPWCGADMRPRDNE